MNAPQRLNNFGPNVAEVLANAPPYVNAPRNANARLNNFGPNVAGVFANGPQNANERINNFGQNVGELFQNNAQYANERLNNFGQNVGNLFQNAPPPMLGAAARLTDAEIQNAIACSQYITNILQRLANNQVGGRRKNTKRRRRTIKTKNKHAK